MSAAQQAAFANASKKAVHVKWAGKTIALGTFPAAEADEKCARAKALTRAWRSSMRPKPTREWVMHELERLGVRVVSGRLGRKAGEDGDEGSEGEKKGGSSASIPTQQQASVTAPIERSNSLGWGSSDADISALMARRNSLGLSIMTDGRRGSLGSLGPIMNLDLGDSLPTHRSLGSGGLFDDQQRRNSSLGLGSLTGGGLGSMGMSVNPNQHYEMLKLHHMNLLNEIQETTLMMNLYQQQQLQQQQQQLQQQANADLTASDPQMALLLQQNQSSLDPMFGAAQLQQQRNSLGLGGSQLGGNFGGQQAQIQMLQQQHRDQQQQLLQNSLGQTRASSSGSISLSHDQGSDIGKKIGKTDKKMSSASAKENKRSSEGSDAPKGLKRIKSED